MMMDFIKNNKIIIISAVAGLGIITYMNRQKKKSMFDKIMKELDSGANETGTIADLRKSVFDINYRKGKGDITLWAEVTVKDRAKKLHSELTALFNTDEDKVYALFSEMPSKLHVNQVSKYYLSVYKRDLLKDVENMGDDEANKVMEIIKSKPEKA